MYQYKRIRYFLISLFFLTFFFACKQENHVKEVHVKADLEHINDSHFKSSGSIILSGAEYQSDLNSRSGKFSLRLDSLNQEALEGNVENIKIGDNIQVQIWRSGKGKNKGILILQIGYNLFLRASEAVKVEGDWELLELSFAIPMEFKGNGIRWYLVNEGNEEVFFDDFSLDIVRNGGLVLTTHPDLPRINLEIKEDDLDKIEKKRLEAIENGVLISSDEDWVKAKISWDDDEKKGKVRLKGDWTDHLYGQKFSLRVNISKGDTLGGYSKFGIQNPVSRHYLDEWFVHQLLQKEGILTTRYEFADLYINNESKGLYAIEEHFTPELLASQGYKNGPILKYSEDDLWLTRSLNNKKDIPGAPYYQGAMIEAFSQDDLMDDPQLRNNFFRGRDLMYQYQFKEAPASEIVDVKKMAAYFAMMDLCNGYHSIIWHNQRFYYNESKDRLDPLVYDIFQENSYMGEEQDFIFIGQHYLENPISYLTNTIDFLFQDKDFIKWYIFYLDKFSSIDYFENGLSKMERELRLYEKEINKEYDFYSFDLSLYQEKAGLIRAALPDFKIGIENFLNTERKPHRSAIKVKEEYEPIKNLSLHAYLNYLPGKTELQVQNFYFKELEIIGLVVDKELRSFDEALIIPPYLRYGPPETIIKDINFIPQEVIYKYAGNDSLFHQKIVHFRAPNEYSYEREENK